MKKGNITETALEIAPFLGQLLDPEVVSSPMPVIAKVGQGLLAYFSTKLFSEYKAGIKVKKLKNKDFLTEKPALILFSLLKIIDRGEIDEERFKAMKSIFFSSVETDAGKEREEIAYLLLQTAKQLSSAEVLILKGNYDVVKNTGKPIMEGVDTSAVQIRYWAEVISKKIGHSIPELVLQHEQHLIELQLISGPHIVVDRNRVTDNFDSTPSFRLTTLGVRLCEFITKYE